LLCLVFESIFLNLWYFSSMSINTFRDRLDSIWFIVSVIVIGGLALWVGFLIMKRLKVFSRNK
jgi:hypothetical protein